MRCPVRAHGSTVAIIAAAATVGVTWLIGCDVSVDPAPGGQDARAFGLELLPTDEYEALPGREPPLGAGLLPAEVDLSDYAAAPGYQGDSASCVAWALSSLMTCKQVRAGGGDPNDASRRFSPAFIFNQLSGGDCSRGSQAAAVLNLVMTRGCCTWATMPYADGQCAEQPTTAALTEAADYRLTDWRRVHAGNLSHVKAFLTGGDPVLVGVAVYPGFRDLAGQDATFSTTEGDRLGGHAVVAVGYNDDRRAVRILNSWGTEWGDGGYAWIAYDVWPQIAREAYIVAQAAPPRFPQITLDLGTGITLIMVELPDGSFVMGSPESDPDAADTERPQRTVSISAFAIGRTEVTQAQWRAVMETDSSDSADDNWPVEHVSWERCQSFCARLSELSGRTIRLPTEAEWEYACRAGSTTRYSFGDSESELGVHAWYDRNGGNEAHPVGGKIPNAWGLYDMHGSVDEWCEDRWHVDYQGAPTDASAWTAIEERPAEYDGALGFGAEGVRVVRGGSWAYTASYCRSAYRRWLWSDDGGTSGEVIGLRVAAEIQ